MSLRIVIDTNVYVSRALRVDSVPGFAVNKAWLEDETLSLPAATWAELQFVLRRPKFAPFIRPGVLEPYLEQVRLISTFVLLPLPDSCLPRPARR